MSAGHKRRRDPKDHISLGRKNEQVKVILISSTVVRVASKDQKEGIETFGFGDYWGIPGMMSEQRGHLSKHLKSY